MPYSDAEKLGITDLLIHQKQNEQILMQLAKSTTKNICNVQNVQEALDIVFAHIPNSYVLLNKKHITKEILFKYLHLKKVSVGGDLTKVSLISKCLQYWNDNEDATYAEIKLSQEEQGEALNSSQQHVFHSQNNQIPNIEQFPIHILARKFTEWFFENYNKNQLRSQDFWPDSSLNLLINANDGEHNIKCSNAENVLDALVNTKSQFDFFFNPNLTFSGVQGRMDVHGLVLVLACGTLHTQTECVGVFECTFALLRDPFADNNWKMKSLQCLLRSKNVPSQPSLEESDSLRQALALPTPEGDLT